MKIILNSIVKNEEKVIRRMLDSVAGIVDAVVICDTGSTDTTREKILEWGREAGKPTMIREENWINFGANRTSALYYARECIASLGFEEKDTYILLIDADMVVKTDGFDPNTLTKGYYACAQGTPSLQYNNIRLVRGDLPFRYVGSTHEYISCDRKTDSGILKSIWIDDIGDGGSKSDKFARDIKLLEDDLAADPTNCRAVFYLAQTYKDVGIFDKAIEKYLVRAEMGGYEEERWYARYQAGCVLLAQGKKSEGVAMLAKAFAERPWRLEPVYVIARHYADSGNHNMAMWYVRASANIGYPSGDSLFIDKRIYDYGMDEIAAVSGYYVGDMEAGMAASDKLWLNPKCPNRSGWLMNSSWYIRPLPTVRQLVIEPEFIPKDWHPCNPSIVPTDDGYLMSLRCVNYTIKHDGVYNTPGYVDTRNFLLSMDKGLNVTDHVEYRSPVVNPHAMIRGFEDVRLFPVQTEPGIRKALCTFLEETGVPSIYEIEIKESTGELKSYKRLSVAGRAEKNWLPYGDSSYIYGWSPVTISDTKTGVRSSRNTPLATSEFRGSAVVATPNGPYTLMAVIHEVYPSSTGKRVYTHRFVGLNRKYEITGVSVPFYLFDKDIEFCSGIALCPEGFILAHGYNDRKALLSVVGADTVYKMMRKVGPGGLE